MTTIQWVRELPGRNRVDPDVSVTLDLDCVEAWNLPANSKRQLTSVGLPRNEHAGLFPETEADRKIQVVGGTSGYRIARFLRLNMLVVPSSGQVIGAVADDPDPLFANSSVELFVDCCWRHYQLLNEIERRGVDEETIDDVLDGFLASINEIDPTVGYDPSTSLWPDVVETW